jgi:hypothetical protein
MEDRTMETQADDAPGSSESEQVASENVRGCPTLGDRFNQTPPSLNEIPAQLRTPKGMTDKQFAAVDLLAQGVGLQTAAQILGVDVRTLYRWRHQPGFGEALTARREEFWSDAVERLRGMTFACLNELDAQLRARHDDSRFRAATTLLKMVDLKKAAADLDQVRRKRLNQTE